MNISLPGGPAITIGVSSCLAGERVRYDGTDRYDENLAHGMPSCFEFCRVCPELGIGLGVPRPPIRLVEAGDDISLRGLEDPAADFSASMKAYVQQVVAESPVMSGYVFKARSPSCAIDDADIVEAAGGTRKGRGMFAAGIRERFPLMPVIDECRLQQRSLRLAFMERVFIYYHWMRVVQGGLDAGVLKDFHDRNRYNLLAHDEYTCLMLDDLVTNTDDGNISDAGQLYIMNFMKALDGSAQVDYARVFRAMLADLPGTLTAEHARVMKKELLALAGGESSLARAREVFLQLPEVRQNSALQKSYFLYPYDCDFELRYC